VKNFVFIILLLGSITTAFNIEAKLKTKVKRKPASSSKELFKKYMNAHLNLAKVLSRARVNGKTCELSAYQSTILNHLRIAHQTNESEVKNKYFKIDTDDITKAVGETLSYKQLISPFSLYTGKGIEKALENTKFYSPAVGAFGYAFVLEFKPDSQLVYHQLDWTEDGMVWTEKKGAWSYHNSVNKKTGRPQRMISYKHSGKTKVFEIREFYSNGDKYFILINRNKESKWEYVKFYDQITSDCDA